MPRHAGFTLVELVVVVAILALMASVGGLAFARLARADDAPSLAQRVREARRLAIRRGVPVTFADSAPGRAPLRATAFPDGRVVADSAFGVEMLTGTPVEARS